MATFFNSSITGFFAGILLVMWVNILALHSVDISVEQIDAATKVCSELKSKIVSLDSYEVTCDNKAVISYKVK